ncbi:hypothetical protein HPP92_016579 [Vanilla planifolia]|uniref:Pentatricopeptide repeat-containing protein n=1 Tax=Vanilla planifolia TaxID=51239 RepID=A0A835QID0_VANPL|nr:hypothetical protein HPP92_016579 [Vanilla planifolia]
MALVFDLMQKQIVKRNTTTFLTIFKALNVREGLRTSPFALKRMKEAGFVLNAFSYNGLIHYLLQSGFHKEALQVYKRMISEGIIPSLKTYSALMVASGKRRNADLVMELLTEMEGVGLKPNVFTFNICIKILGKTGGKHEKAQELFWKMKSSDHKPDRGS